MAELNKIFAANVRRRRLELGVSQTDLAEGVGVTQGHISYIEHGIRWPSPSVLQDLADALKVQPAQLFRSGPSRATR